MSKIIAVWGNSRCGKSTIAALLANKLATSKNVILIDTNTSTPQLNVWFPYFAGEFNKSLSSLMIEDNITKETVSRRIQTLSQNLGVLGFMRGEAAINLSKGQRLDKIKDMYKVCLELADYVVVDCTTSILDNVYTILALELADRVLRVVTPDHKGISFIQSNVQLLSDTKFKSANHIVVANGVKTYHNMQTIDNVIGKISATLPYCVDIEVRNIVGELFKPIKGREMSDYVKLLSDIVGC